MSCFERILIFFPLSHELEIHVVYMPADILNWYVDRCRQLGFDCEAARILKACCYPLLNDKTQARDPATFIPSFSFISLLAPCSSSCFVFIVHLFYVSDVDKCILAMRQLQQAHGGRCCQVLQLSNIRLYVRCVPAASHRACAFVRWMWARRAC